MNKPFLKKYHNQSPFKNIKNVIASLVSKVKIRCLKFVLYATIKVCSIKQILEGSSLGLAMIICFDKT